MAWDFETDPEFQKQLEWIDNFVREEIEPLDYYFDNPHVVYDTANPDLKRLMTPLQKEVKSRKLWACHLTPELGGQGYGQLKLALMNELIGRSRFAPRAFGCQAPDTGNAELIAHFGNEAQKKKYLLPLLEGDIVSCFSMTEPQGGADPGVFKTRAHREGDEYVINGEKWFSSNARFAEFTLVVCVTDPNVPIHDGASIMLVPKGTPGMEIVRNVGLWRDRGDEGAEAYVRYTNCRVPVENCIGGEGRGFAAAQTRLGGGRVHHAMRSVATIKQAFDMMCERSISRFTKGSMLAEKQAVQEMIADSYIQIQQFRLHVLYTAWLIDKHQSYNREVRKEIAAVKVATAQVLHDVIYRAITLHGSIGVSNETPLAAMWMMVPGMATADGPPIVHKATITKQVLRDYEPAPGLFPTAHVPPRIEAARKKYAERLAKGVEHEIANA